MRVLLFLLILLAAAKIGAHEYIRRDATHAALMSAYREHAVAACRQRLMHQENASADGRARTISTVTLSIGDSTLDVHIWQTSHPSWQDRYRTPYLNVRFSEADQASLCRFDVTRGVADFAHGPSESAPAHRATSG